MLVYASLAKRSILKEALDLIQIQLQILFQVNIF